MKMRRICNTFAFLLSFVCHFLLVTATVEHQCTENFMDLAAIRSRAPLMGNDMGKKLDDEIRILREYQFICSTNITSVILGISVKIAEDDRNMYPSIQRWTPVNESSNRYSLDASNERIIYYSPTNISTSGVFMYPLNPPISMNSGDLLAIKQPSKGDSIVNVYYINPTSFRSYQVNIDCTQANLNSNNIETDRFILVYPVTGNEIMLTLLICAVVDSNCVNSSFDAAMVEENAVTIRKPENMDNERQYIYPDMKFTCNGTVTKWIYGAKFKASRTAELQIWHKTTTGYMKVNSSTVNANLSNDNNVYESNSNMEFQEGDIFGIHIPKMNLELYQLKDSGPVNHYLSTKSALKEITSNETLASNENGFPLVTAEISKFIFYYM